MKNKTYIDTNGRICTSCGKYKIWDCYWKSAQQKSGHSSRCKDCSKSNYKPRGSRRDVMLRRNYGISEAEYDKMLVAQGGRCAICRELPTTQRAMHVDHCHETGDIRGVLCHNCNVGLGNYRDNPGLLRAAANYLERSKN